MYALHNYKCRHQIWNAIVSHILHLEKESIIHDTWCASVAMPLAQVTLISRINCNIISYIAIYSVYDT